MRLLHSALTRWEVERAVKQVRRMDPLQSGAVLVCWDLDNTLVNSGALVRVGKRLDEALVEAKPMPNMLALYEALHDRLPEAEHVILSARLRSMRPDTFAWLERHGLTHSDDAVCFVPYADAKPRVWRTLAGVAPLVIIDDLSYGHEGDQPRVYKDLVRVAKETAAVYVGLDEISRIAADPGAVELVVRGVVEALPSVFDGS